MLPSINIEKITAELVLLKCSRKGTKSQRIMQ
jgi:hypothetical protein